MTAAALLAASYDPWGVFASILIATLASYVALDLAKRLRTPDRAVARIWWIGGSIAMGTASGMHFVEQPRLHQAQWSVGRRHAHRHAAL